MFNRIFNQIDWKMTGLTTLIIVVAFGLFGWYNNNSAIIIYGPLMWFAFIGYFILSVSWNNLVKELTPVFTKIFKGFLFIVREVNDDVDWKALCWFSALFLIGFGGVAWVLRDIMFFSGASFCYLFVIGFTLIDSVIKAGKQL